MEYTNKFMLGNIKNVEGNASRPVSADNRAIVIFCTDDGTFEAIAGNANIAKVCPKAKELYRGWWRSQNKFKLGEILSDNSISSDTELLHLVTCTNKDNTLEWSLVAVKTALDKVGKYCSINKKNMHVNKTDNWDVILPLVEETCAKRGVNVFVYGM
jgi:hypothetical protein